MVVPIIAFTEFLKGTECVEFSKRTENLGHLTICLVIQRENGLLESDFFHSYRKHKKLRQPFICRYGTS